jgi:hypothetical protein
MLRPGGWFIFCIPNAGSLNAKIFGRLWAGYDVPRHLFAFSRLGVERMLESAGMKIEDRRTFFGSFSALRYDLKFWLDEKFGALMSDSPALKAGPQGSDSSDSSDLSEKPARGSDVRRTADRRGGQTPRRPPGLWGAGRGLTPEHSGKLAKGTVPAERSAATRGEWTVPEARGKTCAGDCPPGASKISRAFHFALVGPHARPLWAPVMSLVEKFGLGPVVTYAARKPRTVAVRRGV